MTNLEIAQAAHLRPISEIAAGAGLMESDFDPLGRYRAKLTHEGVTRLESNPQGKLVLVTAINPTPAGEGKTTVSVGLAQGLNRIGRSAIPALREPALGPVFGVKGGACGGGYSQVLPMEDINLFFNGDFPAIAAAHNLLSAMLDASIHHGNPLDIELRNVWWPRTLDMIDRSLREIVVGIGEGNGFVRSDGFVITPASEVMAVFCLSESLSDLKLRLGRMLVALGLDRSPVRAEQLKAVGAMTMLLRDAIRPNLVQTIEGGLAMVHGGPFGNIAHGCSSILATRCGLGAAEYLVTEGGFGSDLGGEKFLNIVCPRLGIGPAAIVLVATVRALRYHGDGDLAAGCANLGQHLAHLTQYGPPVLVAINKFADDTDADLDLVRAYATGKGVQAVVCDPWGSGGAGCEALATAVAGVEARTEPLCHPYDREDPLPLKLEKLVQKVYGGRGVTLSSRAERRLKWLEANGFGDLPVCVAKTQMSLSDDPTLKGAPKDFDLHVRQLRVSAGAGFVVAECGDIMLMPGMGKVPAAEHMDVDDEGRIHGLN